MKIRKGDAVQVMAGKDKGKRGKVLQVLKKGTRVTVENVNIVKRHTKAQDGYSNGGIIKKEASINITNVMLVDPKLGRPVRVNYRVEEKDGKSVKVRYSHKFDANLD